MRHGGQRDLPGVECRQRQRCIRDGAEKGDGKFWGKVQGREVVMWVPSDTSAVARCLSSPLPRAAAERRPAPLIRVAAIPLILPLIHIPDPPRPY